MYGDYYKVAKVLMYILLTTAKSLKIHIEVCHTWWESNYDGVLLRFIDLGLKPWLRGLQ